MTEQIIAGPYKIVKHSEEHKGLYEKAYTLCTTKTAGKEEYNLTVRYYRDGRMVALSGQGTYSGLTEALEKTAFRIQRYGEMAGYSVLGHSDDITLEAVIAKTKLPQTSAPVSASVSGTSTPSKLSVASASKGIKKSSPQKMAFFSAVQKSKYLQKKHGSAMKRCVQGTGVPALRRSLRLLAA